MKLAVVALVISLTISCQGRLCPDPVCPADDGSNSTVLLPSADCRNFYSCLWGFPTLLGCPPGLRFLETVPGCVPEDMADCSECEEAPVPAEDTTPEPIKEPSEDDNPLLFANYLPFLHK